MEYSNELTHWGIKGMKWGVRRYQNKDGSLTPAGERRRAKLEGKLEKLGGKKKASVSDADAQPARKKTASEMSDAELDRAINRARKEDEYRRLRPEQVAEKPKFMKQLMDDAVKPALINSGRQFLQNTISKAADNLLKGKADPESIEALKKTYEKLDYKQKIDKILNPDKYLNEEDKTKRYDRQIKTEDRDARMEGYKDAADKAAKQRETEAASRKAQADEAARVANEATSKEYYDATYSSKGGEKGYVNPNESRGLVPYTKTTGENYVTKYSGWNNSYSSLSNDSAVSSGSTRAASIIDKYGNEIFLPDDY